MATKREEAKAWEKLKKAFPGRYVNLTLDWVQYSVSIEDTIKYRAYVDPSILGDKAPTPMEAVNSVIEKAKEEEDGKATSNNC